MVGLKATTDVRWIDRSRAIVTSKTNRCETTPISVDRHKRHGARFSGNPMPPPAANDLPAVRRIRIERAKHVAIAAVAIVARRGATRKAVATVEIAVATATTEKQDDACALA